MAKKGVDKMTTAEIVELLKMEIREEEHLRSSARSTMNIYLTIMIAILGGTVTILSAGNLSDLWLGIVWVLSGILVFSIAYVGLRHFYSDYLRQAEAIVQEAKLEDVLGMSDPEAYPLSAYWKGESLLPESFIKSRKMFEHSQDFATWLTKDTDFRFVKVLYYMFMMIGLAFVTFGILSLCGVLCL